MRPQIGDTAKIRIGDKIAMGIITEVESEKYCRINGLRIYTEDIIQLIRIEKYEPVRELL